MSRKRLRIRVHHFNVIDKELNRFESSSENVHIMPASAYYAIIPGSGGSGARGVEYTTLHKATFNDWTRSVHPGGTNAGEITI